MKLRRQVIRYAAVGLSVNAAAFGAYLLLAMAGLSPLVAMTLTYGAALALGYFMNRRVTFSHDGRRSASFRRYAAAYATGYLLNLGGLLTLVGWFHVPHAWAQGGLVLLVAIVMFALQRIWVFSDGTRSVSSTEG